jgi:preprotein translocase subunit SecF
MAKEPYNFRKDHMKILVLSMLFLVAVRIAELFSTGVKRSIESKKVDAMEALQKQVQTREMIYQELERGENMPSQIRKAIKNEDWDALGKVIDSLYPAKASK